MTKSVICISAPIKSRSGYGAIARSLTDDIIKLYDYKYNKENGIDNPAAKFDVKLIALPFALSALNVPIPPYMTERILPQPIQLHKSPECHIHIGIPVEQQFFPNCLNILYSALIETNCLSLPWVQHCNKADVIITLSNHAKTVAQATVIEEKSQQGVLINQYKVTKPIEILPSPIDTNIFKKIDPVLIPESIKEVMIDIKEKFCFLFVGQFVPRKNVEGLVKIFCEAFKTTVASKRPALILKTNGSNMSLIDREECLKKIRDIRNTSGPTAPNIYLIHGELTDEEMNGLYNANKVKAMVSFTYGESQGIPLLEFTQTGKPLLVSGWSSVLDFTNVDEAVLLPGEIKQIPSHMVVNDMIIPESSAFWIDQNMAAQGLNWVFQKYEQFLIPASRLAKKNAKLFSVEAITARTKEIFDRYLATIPEQVPLKLPTLKKLQRRVPVQPPIEEIVDATNT